MKKTGKVISAILLGLLLSVNCVTPAMASSVAVISNTEGVPGHVEFAPGSFYTETDLFENFKNVMPGDTLTQQIWVRNQNTQCDYLSVFLSTLLHDESGNPISPAVLAQLQADGRKGALSELEYMHQFLEQLTLTVWKGEGAGKELLYTGTPLSLEDSRGNELFVGDIPRGTSVLLTVELAVDIEMGNEFANRIGEVDWVFVFQEENDAPNPDPGGPGQPPIGPVDPDDPDVPPVDPDDPDVPPVDPDDPDVPPVDPDDPDVPPVDPDDPDVPPVDPDDPDAPKTGDNTMIWPFAALFAIGFLGMIITATSKKKKTK